MNIFYEEGGQFKAAVVVQKNDSSYQADTQHGKRAKIKAANVFLEFDGSLDDFLDRARAEAETVDAELLWESCGGAEFTAQEAAAEYFGAQAGKVQQAAVLMALYAAPVYFHKKAKGVFKAAPEDVLRQALAAIERKRQEEAQIQAWADELANGRLPESIAAELPAVLHAPDKQSPAYKAFRQAADRLKLSDYDTAKHIGAVSGLPEYLLQAFSFKHFPHGTAHPEIPLPPLPELPLAEGVQAFSLDDADTSEIDDAVSLTPLAGGGKRLGIHIAAPSLAVASGSPIEQLVQQRQSTVYFPQGKITMLPENWIAAFSLDEGAARPAFSIYFDVDENGCLSEPVSRIERVFIANNLRLHQVEPHFNGDTGLGSADNPQFPFHAELIELHALAVSLQKQRDRYEENAPKKYDYGIGFDADGKVRIVRRERGSPIDTVVSEMMILANGAWAKMLHESGRGGMFRVQPSGRVRMSTRCEAHTGMNLPHYAWFTSPLRRAADCINQQQLRGLIEASVPPRYEDGDGMLFAALNQFETAHAAYRDFQTLMEAYWALVYLQQENLREVEAVVLKDDLVRLDGLPLAARATGLPLEAVSKCRVKLAVTEVCPEKQFVALRYLNMTAQAV